MAEQLNRRKIGYIHIGEAIAGPMAAPAGTVRVTPTLRKIFGGAVMVNGGYDARTGSAAIARGEADLVAYGVPFLANPDLPARYWNDSAAQCARRRHLLRRRGEGLPRLSGAGLAPAPRSNSQGEMR